MVTITYDALNDLVHAVGEQIERTTGLSKDGMLDLIELNNVMTSYLDGYGVQYADEIEIMNTQEAIANIRQALAVIAPIWEDMSRFGHSGADDVAGAQADLEQAIRFLSGEEVPI